MAVTHQCIAGQSFRLPINLNLFGRDKPKYPVEVDPEPPSSPTLLRPPSLTSLLSLAESVQLERGGNSRLSLKKQPGVMKKILAPWAREAKTRPLRPSSSTSLPSPVEPVWELRGDRRSYTLPLSNRVHSRHSSLTSLPLPVQPAQGFERNPRSSPEKKPGVVKRFLGRGKQERPAEEYTWPPSNRARPRPSSLSSLPQPVEPLENDPRLFPEKKPGVVKRLLRRGKPELPIEEYPWPPSNRTPSRLSSLTSIPPPVEPLESNPRFSTQKKPGVMKRLIWSGRPRHSMDEDPSPPISNTRSTSSSFSWLSSTEESLKSEHKDDFRFSRENQPAATGISRPLDLNIEVPRPWISMEERDIERGRRRDKGKREKDEYAELERMIGYLTATGIEDWAMILEVCERASSSEANAKVAIKVLEREFKYGDPPGQLSAARLWAMMLQNSSQVFIQQSSSRKFLETIEDVLDNPHTAPTVRERLLVILAAAVHKTIPTNYRNAFRGLWRNVKSPGMPDNGIPFDPEDPMFYVSVQRRTPSSSRNISVDSRVRARRVKPYPGGDLQRAKEIFHHVTVTWKRFVHPNIVPLLGVTIDSFELILDFMPGGGLLEYIANRPDVDRLSLLSDVAEGLNYLHSHDVVHGALDGSNVLVDAYGHARITDFGLAIFTQDLDTIRDTSDKRDHGVRWIAPEILSNQGVYSTEADVFSFAGVAIEAFTGAAPFSDKSPHVAMLAIMRGERPSRPVHPSLTEGLWTLIQQCWNQEAHLRPLALIISCCFGTPAWKRLIDRPFYLDKQVSLTTHIFSDRDETETVRHLRGDDAQSFVDVVDQMLDSLDGHLRKKALSALCRICGRQALLPRSLQIPHCYERSDEALYSGGYSDVWMGEHQGRKVAVKVLRIYTTSNLDKIISRFCREVMTWKSLRHPNVLPLLGVTMSGRHFAMVSEWMSNGSINEFIAANRDADRFELLKGVARGLIYLHSQGMIHGDLKGANVLIDSSGQARLADFGLLTFISDPTNPTNSNSVTNSGTTRWMSPELLHPEEFGFEQSRPTKKSDCYALGMVILEVLSGEPPFARDKNFIVMRKVIEGERPQRPEGAWFTDDLWGTLQQCWLPEPKDRPTVEAVLECLGQVSETWRPIGNVDTDGNESDSTTTEPSTLSETRYTS